MPGYANGGSIPDRYLDSEKERLTVKLTMSRGSSFVTAQQLLADIEGRLGGAQLEVIYQTGRSYIWFLEFSTENGCRCFIEGGPVRGEGYEAEVQGLCEQRTLIKVHWIPSYVRLSFLGNWFADYGRVHAIKRDKVMVTESERAEGGTIFVQITMTEQGMAALPHVVTFNKGITMLLTLPGRAPLCLKCRCTGHIRRECPQGGPPKTPANSARTGDGILQQISYSQVVTGAAPAAEAVDNTDTTELDVVASSEVGSPLATPLSGDEGDDEENEDAVSGDENDSKAVPMDEGNKQGQKRRAADDDEIPETVKKLAEEFGK